MANVLGELFADIAESIRGGLGDIGKMKPAAFPNWIHEIVAMIGSGEDSGGGDESGSFGELKFASGSFSVEADGDRAVVAHGLGCMPDLIIVQLPQIFSGDGTTEDIVDKVPLVAAWGMKSSFEGDIRSGKVTSIYGLTSPLGIDNMSTPGAEAGYISCPDEETFQVGATGDVNSKLYAGNKYTWFAVSGIGCGTGGSSADVRYVTFMNEDGTEELGKKAVAYGDDCADPIARGVFDTPTKESTDQYDFTFSGSWATVPNGGADANALKAVTEDRVVYANFISAVRYYTVSFYDGDTLLTTEQVMYGGSSTYEPPAKDGYFFDTWEPTPENITGDTACYAQYKLDVDFATATWSEIAAISEAGEAKTYFALGDTKELTFTGTDGKIYTANMAIRGFDHDTLADGSGTAGISLIITELTFYAPKDNGSSTKQADTYWGICDLRTSLNGDVFDSFPVELQEVVKSVNKKYAYYNTTTSVTSIKQSSDKVWIPSAGELGKMPSAYSENDGERYASYGALLNMEDTYLLRTGVPSTNAISTAYYWRPVVSKLQADSPLASTYVVFGICI